MPARDAAAPEKAAEKRGRLTLESTGEPELLVLRRGTLRLFPAANQSGRRRGSPKTSLQLVHRCEVLAEPGGRLRIRARVPYEQEVVLRANSDAEAQSWSEALSASLRATRSRFQGHLQFLAQGSTAYKYNYSNSKRMRRHFWVKEETAELCWGKSRSEEPQTMGLGDCVGIIYGPMTSTFQRCDKLEDAPWSCFSLLFPDRTLDLAVSADLVERWFQGLQHLLLEQAPACVSSLSEAQFAFCRARLKLADCAHRQGLTTRTLLLRELRELAKDPRGKSRKPATAWGEVAAANGASHGGSATEEAEAAAKAERRRRRREEKEAAAAQTSPTPSLSPSASSISAVSSRARVPAALAPAREAGPTAAELQEEDLRKICADFDLQLEAATARLEALRPAWEKQVGAPLPGKDVAELLRADGVGWQDWAQEKVAELEDELLKLRVADCAAQRQLQAAEKAEKQLRKLAKQLKESEAQGQAMEQDLGSAEAGVQNSETARCSSSHTLERSEAETQHLERRKKELEQQLRGGSAAGAGGGELEALRKANQKQTEQLAKLQKERADLAREVGALEEEREAAERRRREYDTKLAERRGASRKLAELLQRLKGSVGTLRVEQKEVRASCKEQLGSISDSMLPLSGTVTKMGAARGNLQERQEELSAERRKLFNVVMELKGNHRVFARVRPFNEKEKAAEPSGEATVTFSDDFKVSVFEAGAAAKRRWFEVEKAFQPKSAQSDVFEEVKALATSVLDGYSACVFAYGQTGSGKTYTMTGSDAQPGVSVRVLRELFRIKEERRLEIDIQISLLVTEIYNEAVRDLLVPSADRQKKLDVVKGPDGTASVPGLIERPCQTPEEALKAMEEAASNRAAMSAEPNGEPSRSHGIVQVRALSTSKTSGRTRVGKLNLVDLAGSEADIDKSLSALGGVLAGLVAKNPQVPYGDSKLTMMLQDSLGGDAKTVTIVQISPSQANAAESLSSLGFASRARNAEPGKAKR